MTIRLKLRLTMLLLIVAAGVIMGVMVFASARIDDELGEAAFANQTIRSVFDLNSLSYDFQTTHGERAEAQWRSAHRRLGEALDRVGSTPLPSEQAQTLKKIRDSHRLLADLFDDLADAYRRRPGNEPSEAERIIGQSLLSRSSLMVAAGFQLSNASSKELFKQKRDAFQWIGVSVSMLVIVVGFIFLVNRRIIGSITRLQGGADAIAQGQFHTVALRGRDELAQLAHAFDYMSLELEKSYGNLADANMELTREADDRIHAESALRATEQRFRSVSETANDAIISADSDGKITYLNHAATRIFGYSLEESIGQPLKVLMPVRFHEAHEAGLKRFLATGLANVIGRTVELAGRRKDGTEFPLDLSLASWKTDDDTFFTGILRDITERQQVQHALQESEKRLRLIADNIPALIAYISREERFAFGNRQYEAAFGVPHDDLAGKQPSEVLGLDVYTQSRSYIRGALAGTPAHFERTVVNGGSPRFERVSYVPDVDSEGRIAGFFSLVEDITELKQTQLTLAESEKRTRMVTDNVPALITYMDKEERYRFCNAYIGKFFGVDPDTLLGRTMREVHGRAIYADVKDKVAMALGGESVNFEGTALVGQKTHYYQSHYIPDAATDGMVRGFYAMTFDFTERKEAELRQAASEERLRTITDNLPALVCYIDDERRFRFNNRTYEKWLHRPLTEITGRKVREVYGEAVYETLGPYIERGLAGEKTDFELEFTGRDGNARHARGVYIPQRADDGRVVGIYGLISDVTSLKRAEHQLVMLARFDSLTGLPNRNEFNERITEAIARSRRSSQLMAVMFLDIDRFKAINDSLGHQAGDEVLKEFSQRLKRCLRTTDTVARLGGDEFVIVLEGLHAPEEVQFVARKVMSVMDPAFSVVGTMRIVTASIGIAVRHEDETDAAALLRRADEALYMAKAAGRNTFRVVA